MVLADDAATRCRRCPVVPRQGRDPRLLDQRPAAIALAFLPTTANGQVAFGTYLRDEAAGAYVSCGLGVLTLLDGCVAEIVASRTVTRFGLPARIRP